MERRKNYLCSFKLKGAEMAKFSISPRIVGVYFSSSFDGKVVLKKDPTVCLDGARTANSCIPPSQDASALTHPFDKLKIAKERV
jgi:hypothetical protein